MTNFKKLTFGALQPSSFSMMALFLSWMLILPPLVFCFHLMVDVSQFLIENDEIILGLLFLFCGFALYVGALHYATLWGTDRLKQWHIQLILKKYNIIHQVATWEYLRRNRLAANEYHFIQLRHAIEITEPNPLHNKWVVWFLMTATFIGVLVPTFTPTWITLLLWLCFNVPVIAISLKKICNHI